LYSILETRLKEQKHTNQSQSEMQLLQHKSTITFDQDNDFTWQNQKILGVEETTAKFMWY